MLFPWLRIGASGLTALVLILTVNPKDIKLFTPANIAAIALSSYAGLELRKLQKHYEDKEREEDMLAAMKDTQATEQLQYLSSAAERKRSTADADKETERQLKLLQQTAPLFQYGSDKQFSSPFWFGKRVRGKGERFEFSLFPFPFPP